MQKTLIATKAAEPFSWIKRKAKVIGQKDYHLLCNNTKLFETGNATKRLKNWIDYTTELLEYREIQPGIFVSRAPEILWQLRPEPEQLDVAISIKLISNITYCPKPNL